MLSYVFKNKKIKPKDIARICVETLNMRLIRNNNNTIFLSNNDIKVLVKKGYTYVLLHDENINISELERKF